MAKPGIFPAVPPNEAVLATEQPDGVGPCLAKEWGRVPPHCAKRQGPPLYLRGKGPLFA